ncbi:MAG: hypothetical protein P9M03_08095 [Candidatus Theseobacter exili]|nr:hypothetical protein [Candidatus Theseobacter exili]
MINNRQKIVRQISAGILGLAFILIVYSGIDTLYCEEKIPEQQIAEKTYDKEEKAALVKELGKIAKALIKEKNWFESKKVYKKWLKIEPDSKIAKKGFQRCQKMIDKVDANNREKEIKLFFKSAKEYEKTENWDEALNIYNNILEIDSENRKVSKAKTRILKRKTKKEGKEKKVNKKADIDNENISQLKKDAGKFYKDKDWQKSLDLYKKWLSLQPDSKKAKKGIESCEEKLNKINKRKNAFRIKHLLKKAEEFKIHMAWDDALKVYNQILEIDPESKKAKEGVESVAKYKSMHEKMFELNTEMKDSSGKGDDSSIVHKSVENSAKSKSNNKDNISEKEESVVKEKQVSSKKDNVTSLRNQASKAFRKGLYDEAGKAYEEILTIIPDDSSAKEGLELIEEMKVLQKEKEKEEFRKNIEQLKNKARSKVAKGELEEALSIYKEVFISDPDDPVIAGVISKLKKRINEEEKANLKKFREERKNARSTVKDREHKESEAIDVAFMRIRAREMLSSGDYSGAKITYQRILEIIPNDSEAKKGLLIIEKEIKKKENAENKQVNKNLKAIEKLLREARKLESKDKFEDARKKYNEILILEKDNQPAIEGLLSLKKKEKENRNSIVDKAEAYRKAGSRARMREMSKLRNQAIDFYSQKAEEQDQLVTVDALLGEAMDAESDEDYVRAGKLYIEVLKIIPRDEEASQGLKRSREGLKKKAGEANLIAAQLETEEEKRNDIKNELSRLYKKAAVARKNKNYLLAKETYEEILVVDPENPHAMLNLAKMEKELLRIRETVLAKKEQDSQEKVKEESIRVYELMELSEQAVEEGQFVKAASLLEEAQRLRPFDQTVVIRIAEVYEKMADQSRQRIDSVETPLSEEERIEIFLHQAKEALKEEKYEKAYSLYMKVLAFDPENKIAKSGMKSINYFVEQEYENEAKSIISNRYDNAKMNAIEIEKTLSKAKQAFGKDDYILAQHLYEKVLKTDSDNRQAKLGLKKLHNILLGSEYFDQIGDDPIQTDSTDDLKTAIEIVKGEETGDKGDLIKNWIETFLPEDVKWSSFRLVGNTYRVILSIRKPEKISLLIWNVDISQHSVEPMNEQARKLTAKTVTAK